jgi:SAM-dependent methyltransferase
VLDFGCGEGRVLDTLQGLGWRTVGMDSTCRVAFQRHREMTTLPTWARFDLVLLHHMLERIGDPLVVLRQLAAATYPGGYLLIGVPDIADAHQHGDLAYCIDSERHVLAYTTGCLEWLCAHAGFRVVSSERTGGARHRQRVVLARREDGRWPLPVSPLRNARAALDRYYARFPRARAPYLKASIRLRAALLNLHWRREPAPPELPPGHQER